MDQNNSTIYALMNETNGMATTDTAGSFPTGPRHLAIDAVSVILYKIGEFSAVLSVSVSYVRSNDFFVVCFLSKSLSVNVSVLRYHNGIRHENVISMPYRK